MSNTEAVPMLPLLATPGRVREECRKSAERPLTDQETRTNRSALDVGVNLISLAEGPAMTVVY